MECLQQVKKRLPENIKVFEGMSALDSNKVLSPTVRLLFSQLPLSFLKERYAPEIEQYRKLCFVDWTNEVFSGSIPSDRA